MRQDVCVKHLVNCKVRSQWQVLLFKVFRRKIWLSTKFFCTMQPLNEIFLCLNRHLSWGTGAFVAKKKAAPCHPSPTSTQHKPCVFLSQEDWEAGEGTAAKRSGGEKIPEWRNHRRTTWLSRRQTRKNRRPWGCVCGCCSEGSPLHCDHNGQLQKQPHCPSPGGWANKPEYTHGGMPP